MRKQGIRLGLSFCAFILVVCPIYAQGDWDNTQLSFEILEKHFFKGKDCHKSSRAFLACYLTIEETLKISSKDEFRILPLNVIDSSQGSNRSSIATVGGFAVVASPSKSKAARRTIQAFEEQQIAFKNHVQMIEEQYELNKNALDFKEVLDWIHFNFITQENEKGVVGPSITKFLNVSLDPHSYIAPMAMIEESSAGNQEIFGIGVEIQALENGLLIHGIFDDSPAAKAGLRPKDLIISIDDADVSVIGPQSAAERIRGEINTVVKVKVQRNTQIIEIQVTRGKVVLKNLTDRVIKSDSGNVGYISLKSFMPISSCRHMKKAITDTESKHSIVGWILDLRDNGGGRLDQAACILGIFVGRNKVVIDEVDPNTNTTLKTTKSTRDLATQLPLVVLMNSSSASASEVVAGALQDYQRAIVVGERSYGKGTVQVMMQSPFDDNVILALTQSRFHLPGGWSNQLVGVTPNIEVFTSPSPTAEERFGLREEDEFLPIPSSKQVFEYKEDYEVLVSKTRECYQNGTAEDVYRNKKEENPQLDFQLLTAVDVVQCMDYVGFNFKE